MSNAFLTTYILAGIFVMLFALVAAILAIPGPKRDTSRYPSGYRRPAKK